MEGATGGLRSFVEAGAALLTITVIDGHTFPYTVMGANDLAPHGQLRR